MTIQELVDKHGLPVRIQAPKSPSFIVHTVVKGGWLVDYRKTELNQFVSSTPALSFYKFDGTFDLVNE